MSGIERVKSVVHQGCMMFKHHAKRALADAELTLFCDLPQYREDNYLHSLPKAGYTINNLKDGETVVVQFADGATALEGQTVEAQVMLLGDDEKVVLQRQMKGILNQLRRDMSEMKRIANRLVVLNREDKNQRKFVGGTRGKGKAADKKETHPT